MPLPEPFAVPLADLQPTQLYLCDEKLLVVLEWFNADGPDYDPLPVTDIHGDLVALDGHHRAFAALLAGADDVRVVRASDVDLAPYRTCVKWCQEAGIDSIADLAGRVLDRESYEEEWIERCEDAFGDE